MILKIKSINQIFILFKILLIEAFINFLNDKNFLLGAETMMRQLPLSYPIKTLFHEILGSKYSDWTEKKYCIVIFWVKLSQQFRSSILLIDEPESNQHLYSNLSCSRSFMNLIFIDISFKIVMIFCSIIQSTYFYRRISINHARLLIWKANRKWNLQVTTAVQ